MLTGDHVEDTVAVVHTLQTTCPCQRMPKVFKTQSMRPMT